jgi:hypothetical protein
MRDRTSIENQEKRSRNRQVKKRKSFIKEMSEKLRMKERKKED